MLKWVIINTISLLIITHILPGFEIRSWQTSIIAVLVIGIINISIKPLLKIITFPITLLTLGLFSIILNTLMLMLAAYITPGFKIEGFLTALIASILNSLIVSLISKITD